MVKSVWKTPIPSVPLQTQAKQLPHDSVVLLLRSCAKELKSSHERGGAHAPMFLAVVFIIAMLCKHFQLTNGLKIGFQSGNIVHLEELSF